MNKIYIVDYFKNNKFISSISNRLHNLSKEKTVSLIKKPFVIMGQVADKRIVLSAKLLVSSAYLYMIIPIVIFFLGWIKLPLGILFSALLLFGFCWHIRNNYSIKIEKTDVNSDFEISVKNFILIAILCLFWIYMSGIGGVSFQRWDFHWRNACLRDLVEFTWPVIYPETGYSFVYYFAHWLLPALLGKIFGYNVANFFLYLYSALGMFITLLLLVKFIKIDSFYKILFLSLIFFTFSYHGTFFNSANDIVKGTKYQYFFPYRYSHHTELVFWVFNQTIVPFVAVSLFLNEKKVSSLALLGLCVLPFAPFPFVGIFILFVAFGVSQFFLSWKSDNLKKFFSDVFSITNLTAIFSILIVFAFFFACNSGANGSENIGGFHWNIPKNAFADKQRFFFCLFMFYFFNFGIYLLFTFKENKKNPLFYAVIFSLICLPFIRIGKSQDFCWRSTVPAFFIIFVMVMKNIFSESNVSLFRRYALVYILGTTYVFGFGLFNNTIKHFINNDFKPLIADSMYTFSDKTYDGGGTINFIVKNWQKQGFYKYLAKSKSKKAIQKDIAKTKKLQEDRNLCLIEGRYMISPKNADNLYLRMTNRSKIPNWGGKDLTLSDKSSQICITLCHCYWAERDKKYEDSDKSRIQFYPENRVETLKTAETLDVPWARFTNDGGIGAHSPIESSTAQRFRIVKIGAYHKIIWGKYALTYNIEDNRIYLSPNSEKDEQLWIIQKWNLKK